MQRRVLLVALWLAFATAAVGVGFGAANLVGDPYTDVADGGVGSVTQGGAAGQPQPSAELPSGTRSAGPESPSPSRSPARTGGHRTPSPVASAARPSSAAPAATPKPTRSSTPRAGSGSGGGATVQRSVTTRGGLVTAGCRNGLVSVGASPAVGWSIDEIDSGRVDEAKVKFRRSGEGEGEIEVHARCASGTPTFQLDDHEEDHGGGGHE